MEQMNELTHKKANWLLNHQSKGFSEIFKKLLYLVIAST